MKTWKYTLSSDTSVFAMSAMVTVLQAHETPEELLTCHVYAAAKNTDFINKYVRQKMFDIQYGYKEAIDMYIYNYTVFT